MLHARLMHAVTTLESRRRVLEPAERISEILFGLIMVLTITCSISVAEAGRDDVRTMLIAALGCNLAWGIIDGVFYLMSSLAEKGRNLRALRAALEAPDDETAHRRIAHALPPVVASVMEPAELAALCERLRRLPNPPAYPRLGRRDVLGALAVFLLVFLSTIPVALPFLFTDNARLALRLSNGVAVAMLLLAGFAYGRDVGRNPWLFGLTMVVLGGVLVVLTIVLGG